MTTKYGLTISFRSARNIALIFFIVGTFLFILNMFIPDYSPIVTLGLIFTAFAVIFNTVVLLILLVDLIRKDRLESFFAICIILANLPVAAGYAYLVIQYGPNI
ncbi:MAG: hypothetical protein AAF489_08105 [Bacteroidota bacterium]